MCGIAGLATSRPNLAAPEIAAMIESQAHRGPDDAQVWADQQAGVFLGHRRLAIVDVSPAGRQPMVSADGRFVIVYNGEIYNHVRLRAALQAAGRAVAWRGHSDSESLVEAIAAFGVRRTIELAHGMFAFGIWDRLERQLTLARDRFGEKPLYVAEIAGGIAFASESKAFRHLAAFDPALSPSSLREMLGRGCVSANESIYRDVRQIAPGTFEVFTQHGQPISQQRYYDVAEVAREGASDPVPSPEDALEALESTLGGAVERQLMSDVPLGSFLSGGIDSSLITALAAERSPSRLQTFSIGFSEAGFDEAPAARAVASHLGTDHHEMYVAPSDALQLVGSLPSQASEPFGDASFIPTYLLAQFARQSVTVALSGDGGDEIFGGYRRHLALPALFRRMNAAPALLRRCAAGVGMAVPPSFWNHLARLSGGGERPAFFGHKVRRLLAASTGSVTLESFYDSFLDEWFGYPSPVNGISRPTPVPFVARELPFELQVMLADIDSYLPNDILAKTDRAAMAVSLEGRIPFLDPEVVKLAMRMPPSFKMSVGQGKTILRSLLFKKVPRHLVDRPKAGFAVPIASWLREPLREWAEDMLTDLADDAHINADIVEHRWRRHLALQEDASQALWNVLMYLAWNRGNRSA
jgi:asparagine synthase (glutamine-hydrolysing)